MNGHMKKWLAGLATVVALGVVSVALPTETMAAPPHGHGGHGGYGAHSGYGNYGPAARSTYHPSYHHTGPHSTYSHVRNYDRRYDRDWDRDCDPRFGNPNVSAYRGFVPQPLPPTPNYYGPSNHGAFGYYGRNFGFNFAY